MDEMKENGFTVHVTGLRWEEYSTAIRMMALYNNAWLIVAVPIILVVLGYMFQNWVVCLIVLAVILALVVYNFCIEDRKNYKKATIDKTELDYDMDSRGWNLRIGGQSGACAWASTLRVTETKHCILLYPTQKTSNAIPKHCLTREQIDQIKAWHKAAIEKVRREMKRGR